MSISSMANDHNLMCMNPSCSLMVGRIAFLPEYNLKKEVIYRFLQVCKYEVSTITFKQADIDT